MNLDVAPTANKTAPATTVWVQTAGGLVETTMPRPATFIAGAGKPTVKTGVDGAVYLDTAAGIFYGPKLGTLWPAIGKLQNVPKEPS